MKKWMFSLLLCIGIAKLSNAQLVRPITPTKTTLSATDTAYATLPIEPTFKSARAYVTKVSGTVGGKVYLIADYGDSNWERLDSLTLANQTLNYKLFTIPNNNFTYVNYRIQFITNSGTQSVTPSVKYLRRS
jgi:hypothetical protein